MAYLGLRASLARVGKASATRPISPVPATRILNLVSGLAFWLSTHIASPAYWRRYDEGPWTSAASHRSVASVSGAVLYSQLRFRAMRTAGQRSLSIPSYQIACWRSSARPLATPICHSGPSRSLARALRTLKRSPAQIHSTFQRPSTLKDI